MEFSIFQQGLSAYTLSNETALSLMMKNYEIEPVDPLEKNPQFFRLSDEEIIRVSKQMPFFTIFFADNIKGCTGTFIRNFLSLQYNGFENTLMNQESNLDLDKQTIENVNDALFGFEDNERKRYAQDLQSGKFGVRGFLLDATEISRTTNGFRRLFEVDHGQRVSEFLLSKYDSLRFNSGERTTV
jgi:hypothetical protein